MNAGSQAGAAGRTRSLDFEGALSLAYVVQPPNNAEPSDVKRLADLTSQLMRPNPFDSPDGLLIAAELVAGLARLEAHEDELNDARWQSMHRARRWLIDRGVLLAVDPHINDNSK